MLNTSISTIAVIAISLFVMGSSIILTFGYKGEKNLMKMETLNKKRNEGYHV